MRVPVLGEVKEDRFEIAKKYGLVKQVGDVWVTTDKSRKNYENFIEYLRGKVDKPSKKSEVKVNKDTVGIIKSTKDKEIDRLFNF